ncbi:MAG: AEC family transporter, partial [Gammaproteobacteria bacterium]
AAAGPGCALVALGVGLAQYRLGGGWREVALLVALKNLLCPLLVWLLGGALGLAPAWLAVAVLMAAMPTGINAYIFASQYQRRQDCVAKSIVASTLAAALISSLLLARFLG